MTAPSLVDQITADMKTAMREKDSLRLTTLRMLKSELLLISKAAKDAPVTDQQAMTCIEKLVKQRKEAARQYQGANREDLADKELQEAQVLQAYLPEPMSEAELTALIDQVFAELKPEGMRDMGKVVGQLKAKTAGRADMAAVSQQVKARLQ